MSMSLKRFIAKLLPPRLRRFVAVEQGATAIEFALVLPVVLLIMLGSFEVPRFVLICQRIARTSSGVADLVAQADEPITANQMTDIFTAAKIMMQPYDIVANGRIYVSSINNPSGNGVTLTWQKTNGGLPGVMNIDSKLGLPGSNPSTKMPATLVPGSNEEVLASEVYFNYTPVFSNLIYSGSQLYLIAYTRPRNKNLMTSP